VDCGFPSNMWGVFYGAGDGTGQKFRCKMCHVRRNTLAEAAKVCRNAASGWAAWGNAPDAAVECAHRIEALAAVPSTDDAPGSKP